MLGNNLPYGTPRFEKAFLLKCLGEEKENVKFMETVDTSFMSEESKKLSLDILNQHELNCSNLLKKIKSL